METSVDKKRKFTEGEEKPEPKTKQTDYYDIYGPSAIPEIEVKDDKGILKIRDLILWIIGEGIAPKWAFVKNKPLIKKIVLVLMSGVESDLFTENESSFPFLKSMTRWHTQAPGGKNRIFPPVNVILNCPILKQQKKEKLNKKKKKKLLEAKSKLPPALYYILNDDQLLDNNFPLTSKYTDSEWIALEMLPKDKDVTVAMDMVAIDCEMCSTNKGLELTRISIVDIDCKVLYDTYVMPSSPIIDYHTRYSGITSETLKGINTTLKEVQSKIKELLHRDTIIIGHSLENDLNALKLTHSKVIDTSILYPNQRGSNYKNALKYLAQRYLNITIQSETHDSVIDATTAMQLTLLKIKNGPDYGSSNEEDTEILFKLLASNDNKCAMIDTNFMIKKYSVPSTSAIPVQSDDEALDKLLPISVNPNFHFVWCQFHQLEDLYSKLASTTTSVNSTSIDSKSNQIDIISKYDKYMNSIHQNLQKNTLLIGITGSGNQHSIRTLVSKKQKESNLWTKEDEVILENSVNCIRKGLAFYSIKQ